MQEIRIFLRFLTSFSQGEPSRFQFFILNPGMSIYFKSTHSIYLIILGARKTYHTLMNVTLQNNGHARLREDQFLNSSWKIKKLYSWPLATFIRELLIDLCIWSPYSQQVIKTSSIVAGWGEWKQYKNTHVLTEKHGFDREIAKKEDGEPKWARLYSLHGLDVVNDYPE